MKKKTKSMLIRYEFVQDKYSEEKINKVYSMLFNEIQELTKNENKYVKSKTN